MKRKIIWLVMSCLMVPLLLSGCGIPQEDYDTVLAERDAAQAQVASLQSELHEARSRIEILENDLATMESTLTTTQSNLARAESDLAAAQVSPYTPEPLPTNPTNIQLFMRVIERLTNLAETYEAKEYVSIWSTEPFSYIELQTEEKCWTVGISARGEASKLIKQEDWFKVADGDYFFDSHWDEPRPVWVVYQDGRITPIGKGIMIEADIEQLNTTRTLE